MFFRTRITKSACVLLGGLPPGIADVFTIQQTEHPRMQVGEEGLGQRHLPGPIRREGGAKNDDGCRIRPAPPN